ncbi:MAG: hypothetical protein JWN74_1518 [Acidobacteriaceae bacterium]|nr:hypothetical protein [Acidobacteriaceae bacterium]
MQKRKMEKRKNGEMPETDRAERAVAVRVRITSKGKSSAMSSLTPSAALAPATAAGALRFRAGFVHINGASADLASIQFGNGLVPFFAVCHLDETESPRTSGFAVGEDADPVDRPIRFEDLAQLILRGVEAEVPNENIFHGAPLSVVANRGEYSGK